METPTENACVELIVGALRDLNTSWGHASLAEAGARTPVYGGGSPVDSLQLVTLIAEIEARASEQWGVDLILADERAMSRHRSPFRDVAALAAFTVTQLAGEGA